MSDSDDWEKNAEKDDAALDDILKTKKFGDEQTAPVEEVKVVVQPVPKQKIGTKLAAKQKKKAVEEPESKENAEERAKRIADGKIQEELADNQITEELFDVKPVISLNTDDDYIEFSREVSRKLHKGQYHFRLPIFYKELFKETSSLMTADDINKIITHLNVIHAEKIKATKGAVKKGSNKPGLKLEAKKTTDPYADHANDEFDDYDDFL